MGVLKTPLKDHFIGYYSNCGWVFTRHIQQLFGLVIRRGRERRAQDSPAATKAVNIQATDIQEVQLGLSKKMITALFY